MTREWDNDDRGGTSAYDLNTKIHHIRLVDHAYTQVSGKATLTKEEYDQLHENEEHEAT
jgi:hypothetical protein